MNGIAKWGRHALSLILAVLLVFQQAPWAVVALADEAPADEARLVAQADTFPPLEIIQESALFKTGLPFLKSMGFNATKSVFPVDKDTLPDGTIVYTVGLNKDKANLFNDLINGRAGVWNGAMSKFKGLQAGLPRGPFFSPAFDITGIYKENPTTHAGTGELAALMGAKGSVQGQFYCFTGEFSLELLGGVRGTMSRASNGSLSFDIPQFNTKATPKLAGGLGAAYIGRLGLYGQSTLNLLATLLSLPNHPTGVDKVTIAGELGVELVICGYVIGKKALFNLSNYSNPHVLYERPSVRAQAEDDAQGPSLFAFDDSTDIYPVVYTAQASEWLGGINRQTTEADEVVQTPSPDSKTFVRDDESSVPAEGSRELQTHIYADAQVHVVDTPSGPVMCWLEADNTQGETTNTRLMWSRMDASGVWSDPKRVDTSASSADDYEPSLFVGEDGTVHAVWLSRAKASSMLQTAVDTFNISYASLESNAQDFGPTEKIASASPGEVKTAPVVSANHEAALIGWTTYDTTHFIAANGLGDLGGTHKVVCATKQATGASWTTDVVATGDDFLVTSLDAGVIGDIPSLAWSVREKDQANDAWFDATSGELASKMPTSLHCWNTRSGHTVVANSARDVHFDDQGVLTWSECESGDAKDDLMYLDEEARIGAAAGSPLVRVAVKDAAITPCYQLSGTISTQALATYPVWCQEDLNETNDSTEGTIDVLGRAIHGTTISEEAVLVADQDDLTAHDVCFHDGQPLSILLAERGIDDPTTFEGDLLVAQDEALDRIDITHSSFEPDAAQGTDTSVTVTLRNAGLTSLANRTVLLRIFDGDQELASAQVVVTLAPGEECEQTLLVSLPSLADDELKNLMISATFVNPDAVNKIPSVSMPLYPASEPPVTSARRAWATTQSSTSYSSHVTKTVDRLAGESRYDTMGAIVPAGFTTSEWVVVASGADYPDALSASAVAGALRAPVIITNPTTLSPQARDLIQALDATHCVIVGGAAAVSSSVEQELRALCPDTTRVAGPDRTSTSAASTKLVRITKPSSDTIFVATGATFADALSVGPVAWHKAAPIVLARADGTLSDEAVSTIVSDAGIRRIVLIGGTASVSEEVRTQLGTSYEYIRLGGANRYQTSSLIASWATGEGLLWSHPHVASGKGFADALTGSALCGTRSAPLLLVDNPADETLACLKDHATSIETLTILGGSSSVSLNAQEALLAAIG